jgi:conjugative relaxase-like TrwC/TraI family protein
MTLHAVSAGSGVDYLMSTVAHGDVEESLNGQSLSGYLGEHGDSPGEWLGRAAGLLELEGEVSEQDADAIFKLGIDPRTKDPLGRRFPQLPTAQERYERLLKAEPQSSDARREQLRARAEKAGNGSAKSGWEMVFSPTKGFSAAWGLSDDAGRAVLAGIEERAFRTVAALIEDRVAWTRIGAGGAAQVKAEGVIGAVFIHRSSRAGDPTYHRHFVISAKVPYTDPKTGTRKWLTIDSPPLHAMTVALSERYTAEMERGLAEIGILTAPDRAVEPGGKRAVREVVGIKQDVLTEFSRRRVQTEAAYAELLAAFMDREGREPTRAESYKMAQTAALSKRPDKTHRGIEAEREDWRRRARLAGLADPQRILKDARAASARIERGELPDRATLPDLVVAELGTRASSWRRSNVEAEATRVLVATGWHLAEGDFDRLVTDVVDTVVGPAHGVPVDVPEPVPAPGAYRRADGESVFRAVNSARFTSPALLAAERDVVDAALAPAAVRTLTAAQVDAALAAGDTQRGFTPSDQQREVVRAVFAGDRAVAAILGRAGTGKTTIMRLVREVAQRHGIAVLGLSTGQVQADQLAAEAGIRAENIARWRTMSETVHEGHPEWTIAPGAIVIVDEASQAGTLDVAALLTQVRAAPGARLLLVGDPLQTGSVAAGGILAELESCDAPTLELTEVKRFRDADGQAREWETRASLALAHGDADASFDAYDQRGRLHSGSAEAMAEAAYRGYLADIEDGLSSVLVAPDNATAAMLSARVRAARIEAGTVRTGREAQLADGNTAAIGDVVATRRNDRRIRTRGGRGYVRNGDTWTVQRVGQDGSLLVRDRISGALAQLPAEYVAAWATLGYAVTQHRAQGLTLDTAHALIRTGMTRNGLYPSMTRGRYANHAYIELTEPVDPETGQSGQPLTPRQVWAAVVERDGTEHTATAQIREARRQAGNLAGIYTRLRYVLADLGTERIEGQAVRELGAQLGRQVTTAAAWPALAELLAALESEGGDVAEILRWAVERRDLHGAVDLAAVLHARITGHPALAEILARRTVADAQVAGPAMLRLLGIVPPPAAVTGEKARFARDLAAAALTRFEQVTQTALAQADARTGWASRYGREPEDADAAAIRRARLQAAAIYRDITGRTDERDPLGAAPPPGQSALRTLWRRAQPTPDPADLRARALAAAGSGERWIDTLGPAPYDPARYPAWSAAAAATLYYRELWGIGHETSPLGSRPVDRVQAADYDHAHRLIQRWRAITAEPAALSRASDAQLRRAADLGAAAAADARAADQARADVHTARRRYTSTAQAERDAANRYAAASAAGADPARVAELERAARRAREEHRLADAALRIAVDMDNRIAPLSAAYRAAAARGEAAVSEQERRAADVAAMASTSPAPVDQQRPWGARPAGRFTDQALAQMIARTRRTATAYQRHQALARAVAEQRGPAVTALRADAPRIAELAAAIEQIRSARAALAEPEQLLADLDAARHGRPQYRGREGLEQQRRELEALTGREARRNAGRLAEVNAAIRANDALRARLNEDLVPLRERLAQAESAIAPQGSVTVDGRGEWDLVLETRDRHRDQWPAVLAEAQSQDEGTLAVSAGHRGVAPHEGERALLDLATLRAEAAIRAAMSTAQRRAEGAARRPGPGNPGTPPTGPRPPRRPGPAHRPPPPQQRPRGPGLGR